jgi:hypothetical protein
LNVYKVFYLLDAEPPEFVNCPDAVTRYTDRGSDVATNVTWDIPTAIDNSQQGQSCGGANTVIINQTDGLDYGSDFQEGFHIIIYQATDGKGLTATCSFYVIIESKFQKRIGYFLLFFPSGEYSILSVDSPRMSLLYS